MLTPRLEQRERGEVTSSWSLCSSRPPPLVTVFKSFLRPGFLTLHCDHGPWHKIILETSQLPSDFLDKSGVPNLEVSKTLESLGQLVKTYSWPSFQDFALIDPE